MLDAAGKSLVIIETVGVGQDEVDIVRTADISIVVLVPGTGDDVQALKAGIMEIADIFVVNKADRDGAERMVTSIESNLSLQSFAEGEWRPPIVKTEATTGRGVPELWQTIQAFRAHSEGSRVRRLKARNQFRLRDLLTHRFLELVEKTLLTPGEFDALVDRIAAREVDPVLGRRGHPHPEPAPTMKAWLDHVGIAVQRRRAGARVLPRRARPARGRRRKRCASQRVRAHFLHLGPVVARTARGDGARFADREVRREARARAASHHAARRRHRRGARASRRRAASA